MRILQSIFWICLSLAVGYLVIVLLMYSLQSNLVYHPQNDIYATPSSVGLSYEEVTFKTEDNIDLHGWFLPNDTANITVLYFHGNAGNIAGRIQTMQLLHNLGLQAFIFDYRGYGKSSGVPTEHGTYRDAKAAWQYLRTNRNIPAGNIVVMGRSLGGAVGAWLAARQNPAAAIIESTFTSAADFGADLYPWLPVRWIIKYEYNTLQNIQQIKVPLFMAHSRDDRVVPFSHSQKLLQAASEPKIFVELEGSHGSGFWETGAKYRDSLQQFLTNYTSY